jgi:hypothetical protein
MGKEYLRIIVECIVCESDFGQLLNCTHCIDIDKFDL